MPSTWAGKSHPPHLWGGLGWGDHTPDMGRQVGTLPTCGEGWGGETLSARSSGKTNPP